MESAVSPQPQWLMLIGWIETSVLIGLIGLSVWSISIMIHRRKILSPLLALDLSPLFKQLSERDQSIPSEMTAWLKQHAQHPAAETFLLVKKFSAKGGTDPSGVSESVDRAVRAYLTGMRRNLEDGITVLATLGSNAPFIGLFGTVLGIIKAFGALSASSAPTQAVMSSISFALIATAAGLFVAIPAVIATNVFSKKIKSVIQSCEQVRDLTLAHSCLKSEQ